MELLGGTALWNIFARPALRLSALLSKHIMRQRAMRPFGPPAWKSVSPTPPSEKDEKEESRNQLSLVSQTNLQVI